jgi:hypothetical protein
VSEPDEALLWARNDWAKAFDEFKPFVAARIGRGEDDGHLTEYVRAYRAGQAASAERIRALEEALEKANRPEWFYGDPEASPADSVDDVIKEALEWGLLGETGPGHVEVFQINTARPCATVWAVVRILTEAEREARDDGFVFDVTECATEAEARALLKEADQ